MNSAAAMPISLERIDSVEQKQLKKLERELAGLQQRSQHALEHNQRVCYIHLHALKKAKANLQENSDVANKRNSAYMQRFKTLIDRYSNVINRDSSKAMLAQAFGLINFNVA